MLIAAVLCARPAIDARAVGTKGKRRFAAGNQIFLAMQARYPKAVDHVVGAKRQHDRPADGHVQLVRGGEQARRLGVVVARFPPPLMAGELDVQRIGERQSGDCAIGEHARDEQREQQHGRQRDRERHRPREIRLVAPERRHVGCRLLCGSRRAPQRERERCHRRDEHERANGEHNDPQIEQRLRLRARGHLHIVQRAGGCAHARRADRQHRQRGSAARDHGCCDAADGVARTGRCGSIRLSGGFARSASSRPGAAFCEARPDIERTYATSCQT